MDCYANNAYSCFGILNRHLDLLMSNSINIQVKMYSSEMKKKIFTCPQNPVFKEYNIWIHFITIEDTYLSLLVFWVLLNILPKFCLKFATHIQFRRVNLKSTLWNILVIVEGVFKGRYAQQHTCIECTRLISDWHVVNPHVCSHKRSVGGHYTSELFSWQ